MGKIKNAFHDEICWNALDEDEKADVLNPLSASRKADRETLADILTMIATKHGASVERQHREQPTRGYYDPSIHLDFACKGVGAMVDISGLHGGAWVLIHWFNASPGWQASNRGFTSAFLLAVKSGGNGRPHRKATSHPRDWSSLAKMLDGGLMIAARGEAFEEHSAT